MIIRSLLDTDLYKFTMMQAVLHQFPGASVVYRFKCRNPGVDLARHIHAIRDEISNLCSLRFRDDELAYLRGLRFMKSDYVDFLGLFQLSERNLSLVADPSGNGEIDITIRGPWLHTIMFEIPLLAIVNEVYFRDSFPKTDLAEGRRRLAEKIALVRSTPGLEGFHFSDFGTRRRFSRTWQDEIVRTLKAELPGHFVGTSNVALARAHGVTPIGTMAHEWVQAAQGLGPRLRDSQVYAFEAWAREYRGDLGIAISDVCGMDAFCRDFDMYFCKLFDGARHDSGDPFDWGEKMIAHYERMRVDPKTKTLVFSDQLTFAKAIGLYKRFKDRARPAFGVGTNLTNDVGYEPLQIVIKMVECNGQPVAKVSDTPGKTMCQDINYLKYLKQVFGIAEAA